jgi:hypothetical protein
MDLTKIEVLGGSVVSIQKGFGEFQRVANRILVDSGIGTAAADGGVTVDPLGWYPLSAMLTALDKIEKQVGKRALFQVGVAIPAHAQRPAGFQGGMVQLMQLLDVGYHFNHRLGGVPMLDPATGAMTEGIGHYRYEAGEGPNALSMVCDNPYPCELDRGIVTGLARELSKTALVVHDAAQPCRKTGADRCIYRVSWS